MAPPKELPRWCEGGGSAPASHSARRRDGVWGRSETSHATLDHRRPNERRPWVKTVTVDRQPPVAILGNVDYDLSWTIQATPVDVRVAELPQHHELGLHQTHVGESRDLNAHAAANREEPEICNRACCHATTISHASDDAATSKAPALLAAP